MEKGNLEEKSQKSKNHPLTQQVKRRKGTERSPLISTYQNKR